MMDVRVTVNYKIKIFITYFLQF